MTTRYDVAVLGGGVAGTAAALAAMERGARTCVITAAPGTTALFAGAWRGACPDGLRDALADVGYELRPCDTSLPHANGYLSSCSSAPPSHEAARLAADTLVIGIAGLPAFDAAMLALQWSARAGLELRAETVQIAATPAAGWSPTSLAAHVERSPDILIAPLQHVLRATRADRVVLPPILGIDWHDATRDRLGTTLNAVVGEALAATPSLPGWRLHNALQAALRAAGVIVIEGKAMSNGRTNRHVESVELPNGDVISARCFVLATGKYVTGGIEADPALREPALGCPVWVDHLDDRFEIADSLMLTDADRCEDQPLLRAGVHVDAEHRPVNGAGDVVYGNVRVAGSVRAGWSVMSHGMGDAAADGWAAGQEAARA